jgi:two-component system response regulator DevR
MTSAPPIRIYLLDDHAVVRGGLRAVLELEDDFEVVGESGTVAEGVPDILRLAPDVAVLDGRLPDGNGIEVCRQVRSANPQVRALILTSYDDEEALFNAILAGSGGYVLKQVDEGALVNSIRAVHQGQSLIDPAAAVRVIERMRSDSAAPEGLSALTDMEAQILDLITEGRRTQAAVLASQLGRRRPG